MDYEVEVMQRQKYEELPAVQVLTPSGNLSEEEELEELKNYLGIVQPPLRDSIDDGRRRSVPFIRRGRSSRKWPRSISAKVEETLPTEDTNEERRRSFAFLRMPSFGMGRSRR
jgi:hypothetical protein